MMCLSRLQLTVSGYELFQHPS